MPDDTPSRHLDQSDVARLLSDTSAESKVTTAGKLAQQIKDKAFSPRELALAEELLREMARDAEVRVRKVLSVTLKDSPELPHDVAMALAKDVAEVAIPVVEFSEILSDEDLIEIIRAQTPEVHCSLAQRRHIAAPVSQALADTADEEVVLTLVSNAGAEIAAPTFQQVLDDFGDCENISGVLAFREDLPIRVAERLTAYVSEQFRERLIKHHNLGEDIADSAASESRERATLAALERAPSAENSEKLVDQLAAGDRLTPTIVLRALCLGHLHFFSVALARLARIPVSSAETLIHDKGGNGLRALYEKCELPLTWYPIALIAIAMSEEFDDEMTALDRPFFRARVIEDILNRFKNTFDAAALKFLIEDND